MALSALAIAGIIGAAKLVVGGALVAKDTNYDSAEKLRVQELRDIREADGLGLTEREKQLLYQRQQDRASALTQQTKQRQDRALAGATELGAGVGFDVGMGEQRAAASQQADITRSVEAADLQRAQEMEDEYWARLANRAEVSNRKLGTILSMAGVQAQGLTDVAMARETTEGRQALSSNLSSKYNLSSAESDELLNMARENPEILNYISALG